MSANTSVRDQNRNFDEDWYHIRILEPLSGQIRTLCLYDGISFDEVTALIKVAFSTDSDNVVSSELGSILGLRDEEADVFYPISFLTSKGSVQVSSFLHRKSCSLVTSTLDKQNLQQLPPPISYNSVGDSASYCTDNSNSLFNNSEKTVFDKDDLEDGYSTSSEESSYSPTSSNGSGLFKEDNIKAVFDVLDANKDGAIHKEEFITAMTEVYKLFFAAYGHYNVEVPDSNQHKNRSKNLRRRGFAFAYSCMTARELAVNTAVRCYGAVSLAMASQSRHGSGTYFLSHEDLYAWYLFYGSEPYRDLMIHAMDFFIERRHLGPALGLVSRSTDEAGGKGLGNRTLHRNKSLVSLLSNNNNRVGGKLGRAGSGLVTWSSLEEFVFQCQQQLNLSSPGSASYLHHLLLMASSSSSPLSTSFSSSSSSSSPPSADHRALLQCNQPITKEKFLKTFSSFLTFNGSIGTGREKSEDVDHQSLSSLLDAIFEICSMEVHLTSANTGHSKTKVPVCNILSLLTILCDSPTSYLQNYQSLFDAYKLQRGTGGRSQEEEEDSVTEVLLYNHLSQVFRLTFYFNASFNCSPDDLAYAISSKYLAQTEINRKGKGNLNFDEFLELLTQSIRLGLRMLQVKSGFIVDSVNALVGWQSLVNTSRENGNLTLQMDRSIDNNDQNETSNSKLQLSSPSLDAIGGLAMLNSSGSSDVSPVEYFEDSQIASFFIDYCGDEVKLSHAKAVFGLAKHSAEVVLVTVTSFSSGANGLLSNLSYQKGMMKMVGPTYISLSVLQRSVSDFILDRLFSIFDPTRSGFCSSRDICCALALFCGGSATGRAEAVYRVLQQIISESLGAKNSSANLESGLHLLTVVQCISALLKAYSSLDPTAQVYDFAHADHVAVRTTLQYVFHLRDPVLKAQIEGNQIFPSEDFVCLFSTTLTELELGDEEEMFNLKVHSPIRKIRGQDDAFKFAEDVPASNSYDNGNGNVFDKEDDSHQSVESLLDDEQPPSNPILSLDMNAMKTESNGHAVHPVGENDSLLDGGSDDYDEGEDEELVYKNDELFPPSATVLELRAARSILGLESYNVCEMMKTLAEKSEEGILKLDSWLSWLFDVMLRANVSQEDIKIASGLGRQLFRVFSSDCRDPLYEESGEGTPLYNPYTNTSTQINPSPKGKADEHRDSGSNRGKDMDEVVFATFAAGLAFLCGGSPTGDKIMVAFTLLDGDSDGYITLFEFRELVAAALKAVAVCSKLAQRKVLHLGTNLRELADVVSNEAMSSLGLKADEELSLEMVCELAEDFLKVVVLY